VATRATTNIKIPHYRLLYRTAAAFSEPAGASSFAVFLATFTEIGYAKKGMTLELVKGDVEELDDGTEHVIGYNGKLEGELLQTLDTDYDEIEGLEGVSTDYLLYDEDLERCVFLPTALMYVEESVVSGEIEVIPITFTKKNVAARTSFRTRFAEPTT
jgi:hypothetical protein